MKINSKIVGYSVSKPAEDASGITPGNHSGDTQSKDASKTSGHLADVIQMHETLERPHKPINDIVLNEGTEHEMRRPFEVFINSKNLEHYQWIVALTLIMSAVFRKGGDITFLVDELRSVFDPRGGYWNKGKYMPSIIAEIGEVIERHLIDIGMLKGREPDEAQAKLIEEKKAELRREHEEGSTAESKPEKSSSESDSDSTDEPWMATATLCGKCNTKSVVLRDGCHHPVNRYTQKTSAV